MEMSNSNAKAQIGMIKKISAVVNNVECFLGNEAINQICNLPSIFFSTFILHVKPLFVLIDQC